MELQKAEELAKKLMVEHGLGKWEFKFDNAKRRFGLCSYVRRTIQLSRELTELNVVSEVEDTILHEIAHALSPCRAHHGPAWKKVCREIGARPSMYWDDEVVKAPPSKFIGTCPNCGREIKRMQRRVLACGKCCKEHNGGKYTPEYNYVYKLNK